MRRTQPITAKISSTTHVHLLQWLNGKQHKIIPDEGKGLTDDGCLRSTGLSDMSPDRRLELLDKYN